MRGLFSIPWKKKLTILETVGDEETIIRNLLPCNIEVAYLRRVWYDLMA